MPVAVKKCPNCGKPKCGCRPSEKAMASSRKTPASPIKQTAKGAVVPTLPGSALWFAVQLAAVAGFDGRTDPRGQDLLALGVRMSEADRRRLVDILTKENR